MGKIPEGIHGPIVGKVGKVHGSSRNGVAYLKGPYKKRTKKVSVKELNNRERFAVSQVWLQPIIEYLREGFRGYSQKSYGFAAAKSNLMRYALEGFRPDVTVNPALVQVSSGTLLLPVNIAVEKTSPKQIKFSWDTVYVNGTDESDQVMMLAYNIENKKVSYRITGQFRKNGEDVLPIIGGKDATFHLYIAFVAADRSRQSDSMYLGTITF